MKNLLILIAFVLCFVDSSAQYHPLLDTTNVWSYTENQYPVRKPAPATLCTYPNYNFQFMRGKEYTYGDTTLNSKQYKKLYIDNAPCLYGFIREDVATQKVYFQDVINSPEVLLYDFSMQVNDSMYVTFINSTGFYSTGYFKVDSIKNITIQAGARKKYYLRNRLDTPDRTLVWIESVGSLTDVIYPYSKNDQSFGPFDWCNLGDYKTSQLLTCFEHSNKVYFDTCMVNVAINDGCLGFIDSCTYGNICSAVQEYEMKSFFTVGPNPASNNVTISNNSDHTIDRLAIYDLCGKTLSPQLLKDGIVSGQGQEIQLAFPSGIYIIEATTRKGKSFQRISVIE